MDERQKTPTAHKQSFEIPLIIIDLTHPFLILQLWYSLSHSQMKMVLNMIRRAHQPHACIAHIKELTIDLKADFAVLYVRRSWQSPN